jgi:F-type H+-transporting ATPase subunit epsilon
VASESFTLELVTPERLVVREEVEEAQVITLGGYIGVLRGHTPLLAELGTGLVTYRAGSRTRRCTAMGGFVEVLGDRVIVLADRAERAEEIDLARAQAARDRARNRLAAPIDPQVDWKRAQKALERAQARIRAVSRADEHHLLDSGHEAF